MRTRLFLCGFTERIKPVILIIGGSSGARSINTAIRGLLPELIKNYNIIHLCGKGNLSPDLDTVSGYAQFEYANRELADMFALASLVISRAGANAICELLALRKLNILIPLPSVHSGNQILNANSFVRRALAMCWMKMSLQTQLYWKRSSMYSAKKMPIGMR